MSIAVVALAEMGDKTQLLALALSARYGRPLAILAGILVATLANHALAAAAGTWVARALGAEAMRIAVGVSFVAMALWALRRDRFEDTDRGRGRWGVFAASLVAFFLVEMGDKTQLATVALAAAYDSFAAVVAGTTAGMMLANLPAVLAGARLLARLPLGLVRALAAGAFAALGLAVLAGVLG